jgi:hypothetical protein
VYALVTVPAAAAPHLSPVTTRMPSGVTPASVEIEPDGTAYVQGESLSKEVLLPEVYVYSAAGALVRRFSIPAGTGLEAFGNGELHVGGELTEHLYGVNPQSGVKGGSFSADGSSIYAGVVVHRGAKGSTFVARLSLSGKILEQLGSIPTHNTANFWEYDGVQVAANGDGWAIRSVPGKLYRFHA